jgi:hypothetical protein
MASIIQIRRDTASNWSSANPTLAQGELGLETDTLKVKAGTGSANWASLSYLIDTGGYVTATYSGNVAITGSLAGDNIKLDGNAISSTNTNGNIQLFPNGTGYTELYGNTNAGTIRFNCENNSHGVTVQGPAHSAAATYTVKLPNTLGLTQASGLVTSDANGVVSFDNGTIEESTTITSSSNAATLNLRDGNSFLHDLTENVTYTFSNPAASGKLSMFTLKIIQDSSARTITWPSSVDWAAATAPTLVTTMLMYLCSLLLMAAQPTTALLPVRRWRNE